MKLKTHDRYDYSAITQRKDYSWPGGKRLAVHFCLNVEHFSFGEGLGNDYATPHPQPNTRSFAWRDYGNRVGAWRLLELAEAYDLPYGLLINTALYDYCPEMVAAFSKRGDEIVGHGRTNAERQGDLWELDERRLIDDVTQEITRREGRPPKGWMGPAAAESNVTPDLLKEAGYSYVMDWPADDQPFWLRTRSGPILSVPYPAELNDSASIIHRENTAREFADMIVDQFDEMVEQSEHHPLVMNVSVHTYVFGQPFRLRRLRAALQHCRQHPRAARVWWCRPRDVAEHCYALDPALVP
ncbi:MAG: polysaccharide deacetylase family protein [Burkholderiales bacterium]